MSPPRGLLSSDLNRNNQMSSWSRGTVSDSENQGISWSPRIRQTETPAEYGRALSTVETSSVKPASQAGLYLRKIKERK